MLHAIVQARRTTALVRARAERDGGERGSLWKRGGEEGSREPPRASRACRAHVRSRTSKTRSILHEPKGSRAGEIRDSCGKREASTRVVFWVRDCALRDIILYFSDFAKTPSLFIPPARPLSTPQPHRRPLPSALKMLSAFVAVAVLFAAAVRAECRAWKGVSNQSIYRTN